MKLNLAIAATAALAASNTLIGVVANEENNHNATAAEWQEQGIIATALEPLDLQGDLSDVEETALEKLEADVAASETATPSIEAAMGDLILDFDEAEAMPEMIERNGDDLDTAGDEDPFYGPNGDAELVSVSESQLDSSEPAVFSTKRRLKSGKHAKSAKAKHAKSAKKPHSPEATPSEEGLLEATPSEEGGGRMTRKRPSYIIAHRINDGHRIERSLNKGANFIEVDVRYNRPTIFASRRWVADHDGVYAWSTQLDDWLKDAKRAADRKGDAFAGIIFDIKTPTNLVNLRSLVRARLPNNLNVIYGIAKYNDRDKLKVLFGDTRSNEGYAIDEDNYPQRVQRFFKSHGVNNFWYGNGILVAGIGPNVRASLVEAAKERDNNSGIKKTYVWTLASDSSILDYFKNVKVDGVMVNESTLEDARRIAMDAGNRIAGRNDAAFGVF